MEIGFSNQLVWARWAIQVEFIPFVGVQIGDHGAGLRAQFGAKSVRISFKRDHVFRWGR